jgi:hypothetical protein
VLRAFSGGGEVVYVVSYADGAVGDIYGAVLFYAEVLAGC